MPKLVLRWQSVVSYLGQQQSRHFMPNRSHLPMSSEKSPSKTKTATRMIFSRQHRRPSKRSGGKYVAGGFNKTVTFDGAPPPNRVVILQFESMDAAKAWNDSPGQKTRAK